VVTVSDSINDPRLPAMRSIMKAKKMKIETLDLAGLGTSPDEAGCGELKSETMEFMKPKTRQAGQKFEGDPAEITAQVVGLLVREAKLF
jgi:electron transfer flavoprotein beta subunit